MKAIVTFSLGKDFEKVTQHDWKNKVSGPCPLAQLLGFAVHECSDCTGRHHNLLIQTEGNKVALMDIAKHYAAIAHANITRVEEIV